MDNLTQMYVEETSPSNEIKGFTKSFVKRKKDKKTEDVSVKELLGFVKDKRVVIGAKVIEKKMKNNQISKVFLASNCQELVLRKIKHYAKISNVEVLVLDLDSSDLSLKLAKPFLVNVVGVVGN